LIESKHKYYTIKENSKLFIVNSNKNQSSSQIKLNEPKKLNQYEEFNNSEHIESNSIKNGKSTNNIDSQDPSYDINNQIQMNNKNQYLEEIKIPKDYKRNDYIGEEFKSEQIEIKIPIANNFISQQNDSNEENEEDFQIVSRNDQV